MNASIPTAGGSRRASRQGTQQHTATTAVVTTADAADEDTGDADPQYLQDDAYGTAVASQDSQSESGEDDDWLAIDL